MKTVPMFEEAYQLGQSFIALQYDSFICGRLFMDLFGRVTVLGTQFLDIKIYLQDK